MGLNAQFVAPYDCTISVYTDIYVTDPVMNTIRRLSIIPRDSREGEKIYRNNPRIDLCYNVTTVAGSSREPGHVDTRAKIARFRGPTGVVVDDSEHLFIADTHNKVIRLVEGEAMARTYAGTGKYPKSPLFVDSDMRLAHFDSPVGIAMDTEGRIFISEPNSHRLRLIDYDTPLVEQVAATITMGLPP
mmetsp:Transcript_18537/g.27754  ORF Transcript_18537/g.27754 Transcript_18537/m.27754 type:complete len:188 (-) Transcript_18537:9-572(-)